mmetsp:Transcript_19900/g.41882  ORF Transcript_19900/g.41882 Transcript_19900/m.41882 type:complete len:234 (+) Transcript_19900:92-793(+)
MGVGKKDSKTVHRGDPLSSYPCRTKTLLFFIHLGVMILRWGFPLLWRIPNLRRIGLPMLRIILSIRCCIRVVMCRCRRCICRIMLRIVLLCILLRFLILRMRVSGSRGRLGLRRQLLSIVSSHFLVEPLLIVVCQIFVLLLVLGGERPPALAHDVSHFSEFHLRSLFHYFGTLIEGKEDVRPTCALGCIGIFVLLGILSRTWHAIRFQQVTIGIKSGRRRVICHFSFVPGLVL